MILEKANEINQTEFDRLQEMYDAMLNSIENAQKIIKEQDELINVIEESTKAEDFADFVKSMKEQTEDINKQIAVLEERRRQFEIIKGWIEDENTEREAREILHAFIEFFGIFSRG